MAIEAGYLGYAVVNGLKVRCTDFNVKMVQNVLFYDHIIGLRDSVPTSILGSKGDNASWNEQKIFYRPGTKIVEGSVSFPLLETSASAFYIDACKGNDINVDLFYGCHSGKEFKRCKVNTYSFTATAGEGGTVTASIMGIDVEDGEDVEIYDTAEKIITWDEIKISGAGANTGIVSLDFTINNNCIPIYTAGNNISTPLLAKEIRVGMQAVTGSISFYNEIGPEDGFVESEEPRTITVKAGIFSATLTVLYQYPERSGQVPAYVRTIPFVGVGRAVT